MVYREIKNDLTTGAQINILYEHAKIHLGDSFTCHYEQTVSDTNDRTIIAFKTGGTKLLHVTATVFSTTVADAYFWEAPTITDDNGATLTVYNRRRDSSTTTTVIDTSTSPDTAGQAMFFTEVTMGSVTGGTELFHAPLIADAVPKPLGGDTRDEQEWLLKPNTLYAWDIKSSSDADNTCRITLDWYELKEV